MDILADISSVFNGKCKRFIHRQQARNESLKCVYLVNMFLITSRIAHDFANGTPESLRDWLMVVELHYFILKYLYYY